MDFRACPRYLQVIVALGVCVTMAGLANGILFEPQQSALRKQEKHLAALQKEVETPCGMGWSPQLPDFKKEVRKLEAKLEALRRILPERNDDAELLRTLRGLADLTGLTIVSLQAERPRHAGVTAEHSWRVIVDGSYHDLALFFDRLFRTPRLVHVRRTTIRAVDDGEPHTIRAQFTATAYILNRAALDEITASGRSRARSGSRAGTGTRASPR